jgi:hypothetical protein
MLMIKRKKERKTSRLVLIAGILKINAFCMVQWQDSVPPIGHGVEE